MIKKTVLMFSLFLLFISSHSQGTENIMGQCDGVDLAEKLESNLTVFDSIEGVEKFISNKLPRWALLAVIESSKSTVDKFFKGHTSVEKFHEARNYFIENFHSKLIKRSNEHSDIDNDCEMEMGSLIDVMSRNKIYNLFNTNFHKMYLENSLSLRLASTDNFIEVLLLIALPTVKSGQGICNTYKQKGAINNFEITVCN
jgi:hypothetical protein